MSEDYSEINGEETELRKAQLRMLEILVEFDRICKKHSIPYFISGGTCLGAVRHGGFIPWDDDIDIDVLRKDYKKLNEVLIKELSDKYFVQNKETDKAHYQLFTKLVDKNSLIEYPETNSWLRKHLKYKGLFVDILPIENVFSYRVKKFIDYYYIRSFNVKRNIGGNKKKKLIAYTIWPLIIIAVATARFISKFSDQNKFSHSYGTNIVPKINYSNIFPVKPILFEGKYFSGPAKPHEYLTDLYGDYMTIPSKEKRIVHAQKIKVY